MIPTDFKAWRKARKLSQAKLATLLGWSRDVLYNRESGRVAMPDDIEERLAAITLTIKPKSPARTLLPFGSYRLSMALQPIDKATADAMAPAGTYWRHSGKHPENGHVTYSLFRVSSMPSKDPLRHGLPAHLCTFIQLDAEDWTAYDMGAQSAAAVEHINKWLEIERPRLEQIIYQQPAQTT